MTEKKQLVFTLLFLFAMALIFVGPGKSVNDDSFGELRDCKHNKGKIECIQKMPLKDKITHSFYYLR